MSPATTPADPAAERPERFEDQLARLESVVARLEDETVGLEEALELFEVGMRLAASCRGRLEEVEQRVATLLDEAAGNGAANGTDEAP